MAVPPGRSGVRLNPERVGWEESLRTERLKRQNRGLTQRSARAPSFDMPRYAFVP